ncbi:hypothetical protein BB559_002963 [Furculomyces boomerangus]|uniref:Uncharacterized protein n=1 Tax=Furculomyces boomerangus TaxID=61424 RepID=A0A2T9YQJ7_9FUNG|nr:hypothetical protein BB559_002963 [Furculomyces boomerangus]
MSNETSHHIKKHFNVHPGTSKLICTIGDCKSVISQTPSKGCTELVTDNGCPFSMMKYPGFRKIIGPILDGLGGKLVINSENNRSHVNSLMYD